MRRGRFRPKKFYPPRSHRARERLHPAGLTAILTAMWPQESLFSLTRSRMPWWARLALERNWMTLGRAVKVPTVEEPNPFFIGPNPLPPRADMYIRVKL